MNLFIAHTLAHRQGYRVYSEHIEFAPLERFGALFRWLIWGGVLFAGYVVSQWGMGHWLTYLRARQVPVMGMADPLFGRDLGFYLFQLPYTWFLYHLALITVICCLLSATFLYLAEGGVWVTPRGPVMARAARAHLMTLGRHSLPADCLPHSPGHVRSSLFAAGNGVRRGLHGCSRHPARPVGAAGASRF